MTPTSVLERPPRRPAPAAKPARRPKLPKAPDERINRVASIPFIALHFVPLLAIFTGVTRADLILCAALYFGRMFFITAGYHRYFAHRSYKMARVPQFLMALGGTTAAQKGPLWWAAHHRDHHRYSDTDRDVHSPIKGFWWSHVGWILSDRYKATKRRRHPRLRALPRAALARTPRLDRPVGRSASPPSSSADGAGSWSGSSRRPSCCGTARSS